MEPVQCPYCLGFHDFTQSYTCSVTGWDVPVDYVSRYDSAPPLWLMAIGYSKHGKTSQLAAMSMVLDNIGLVWENTALLPLDTFTVDSLKTIRRQVINGETPSKTQVGFPRPLLFHAYQIPEFKDKTLVLFDTPGELFENIADDQQAKYLQFLKQITTIWFVADLDDLLDNQDRHIDGLLSFYLEKMKRMGVSLKERNLVVIYTKADKFINNPGFPEVIRDYVLFDKLRKLTKDDSQLSVSDVPDMSEYIKQMKSNSAELGVYTKKQVPGGMNLVTIAKINEMKLYFCITSAQGANNTMAVRSERYRVLDPFFWALELCKTISPNRAIVIIDAGPSGQSLFSNSEPKQVLTALPNLGHITVYNLGQKSILSHPGQALPGSPNQKPRARLIGPILDGIPKNTPLVVLTSLPIRDLDDFERSLGESLLLISYANEEVQPWPTNFIFRPGDRPDLVLDYVKRFIKGFYEKQQQGEN